MSVRRCIALLAGATFAAWLMGIGALFGLRFSENFDVIEAGMAYRSGQLLPDELDVLVEQSGIRSIISLVPAEPDQSWYVGEVAVSAARHLVRYEMPLSPQSELTSGEMCRLVALLQNAPKPVLIHSRSGADRTGLAAAIYKYAVALRPVEEARSQLSIRYGHFPYLVIGTGAMDISFQRFLLEQEAVGC
jgi:protein tyrosine/serine phosphatase